MSRFSDLAIELHNGHRWTNCWHCEHPFWTDQPVPVCDLCQMILNHDHTGLDRVATLMTEINCEPHVAAKEVNRLTAKLEGVTA